MRWDALRWCNSHKPRRCQRKHGIESVDTQGMARMSRAGVWLAAVVVAAAVVCAVCSLGTFYLPATISIVVALPTLAVAAIAWIALGISCARASSTRRAEVRLWLVSGALLVGVLALNFKLQWAGARFQLSREVERMEALQRTLSAEYSQRPTFQPWVIHAVHAPAADRRSATEVERAGFVVAEVRHHFVALVRDGFQGTYHGFLYNPPEQQTVVLGDRLLGREIVRLEPLSGSWHLFVTR